MCRREISPDYLEHPDLLQGSVKPSTVECPEGLDTEVDEACGLSRSQEPRLN